MAGPAEASSRASSTSSFNSSQEFSASRVLSNGACGVVSSVIWIIISAGLCFPWLLEQPPASKAGDSPKSVAWFVVLAIDLSIGAMSVFSLWFRRSTLSIMLLIWGAGGIVATFLVGSFAMLPAVATMSTSSFTMSTSCATANPVDLGGRCCCAEELCVLGAADISPLDDSFCYTTLELCMETKWSLWCYYGGILLAMTSIVLLVNSVALHHKVLGRKEIVHLVQTQHDLLSKTQKNVPQQIIMRSSLTDVVGSGVVENLVGMEEVEEVDVADTVKTKQGRVRSEPHKARTHRTQDTLQSNRPIEETLLDCERRWNEAAKAIRAANRSRRRRQQLWEQEVYGGGSYAGSLSGARPPSTRRTGGADDNSHAGGSTLLLNPAETASSRGRGGAPAVAPSFESPARGYPRKPVATAEVCGDRVTPPVEFAALYPARDTDIEMSRLGSPTSAAMSQSGQDEGDGNFGGGGGGGGGGGFSIGAYTGGTKNRLSNLEEEAARISSWGRGETANTGAAMNWVAGGGDGDGQITPKTALRFKTSALSRAMHR
ncbi:unnamed protein product [Ectocarpus sp. CCAP 1310/34]|nr:unnamed protein product [Ectocarpus sp. CCAP 1310/34]